VKFQECKDVTGKGCSWRASLRHAVWRSSGKCNVEVNGATAALGLLSKRCHSGGLTVEWGRGQYKRSRHSACLWMVVVRGGGQPRDKPTQATRHTYNKGALTGPIVHLHHCRGEIFENSTVVYVSQAPWQTFLEAIMSGLLSTICLYVNTV
jgi:hypothetical protein